MSSATTPLDPAYAAQDGSSVIIALASTLLPITTLIVGARVYTRACLLKHFGWDDICALITLAVCLVDGALILATIRYGLGRHIETLSSATVTSYLQIFWASIVVYNIGLTMIKLTFLFQYNRVLAAHKMQKVVWIFGAFIMAWAVSQIFVTIFDCVPIQKFWDGSLAGTCTPNIPFWYINAAGNIATDLSIIILPLPILGKLQLRKKQKYFLVGIFSLGFFTCAISLIRLKFLKQGADFTFDNVPTACWSLAEILCGLICACLPTLRPLMIKIRPRWMTSYATRSRTVKRTGATGAGARYGGGTLHGTAADAKSAGTSTTQGGSTPDGSLTLSLHKNYNRLDDDDIDDVEKALRMPTPLSPIFCTSDSSRSSESEGREAIPMQGLPPRAKSVKISRPTLRSRTSGVSADENAKAISVLGMGLPGVGVSTRVFGGKTSSSPSTPSSAEFLGGIEVKRDVTVTTTPVEQSSSSQQDSFWKQRR